VQLVSSELTSQALSVYIGYEMTARALDDPVAIGQPALRAWS
jgi:hypothetical protein